MDKQVIWVYGGYNINGQRPMNLNVGAITFVKKIFDNPYDPKVQEKIIEFSNKIEAAKVAGHKIKDVSTETFDDPTTITSIEQAIKIADKQMGYIEKTSGKMRR